jgi:hypothetical protein
MNGILICESNFEIKYGKTIRNLCSVINTHELHGNELGLGKIDLIANELADILLQKDIGLFFARIDKVYLAKLKFFDTYFDNGLNKAVCAHRYGVRSLRLILANKVTELIDDNMAKCFWTAYKTNNYRRLKELINKVYSNASKITDEKAKEVIQDALLWASENICIFSNALPPNYDVPNTAAMSMLIANLNHRYRDIDVEFVKFIHDEQNEFKKVLKEVFDYIHVAIPNYKPNAIASDIEIIDKYSCDFEMRNSKESLGLQFIDILLWFTKKFAQDKKNMRNNNKILQNAILSKAHISEITKEAIADEVSYIIAHTNNIPITKEQLAQAKKNIDEIENLTRFRLTN